MVPAVDWGVVQISKAAQRTINPIRKVVDRLQVPPNPQKTLISLGLGDPSVFGNLDTHEKVTEAVKDVLLSCRSNGYPPASGDDRAKEAIAKRYSSPAAPLTPNDVIVASGCSGALELIFGVLANEGDTILLPRPGFTLYGTICQSKEINAHYYALQPDNNWQVDLVALRSYLESSTSGSKIAAWLINNPSNPCGSVYSREHLQDCLALAEEFRIPVIADEIYEDMVFSGHRYVPMRTLPSSVPILTCSGMAKRFLVPGWRVGWILITDKNEAFKEVRAGLTRLSAVLLGANSLIQSALPAIFAQTPPSFYEETNKKLEENANIAAKALEGIPGVRYVKPQGAMYMMVGFDMAKFKGFADDAQLSEMLISEESVLCLPGSIFGMKDYLRIVFCGPKDKISEACERIRSFCLRHQA